MLIREIYPMLKTNLQLHQFHFLQIQTAKAKENYQISEITLKLFSLMVC